MNSMASMPRCPITMLSIEQHVSRLADSFRLRCLCGHFCQTGTALDRAGRSRSFRPDSSDRGDTAGETAVCQFVGAFCSRQCSRLVHSHRIKCQIEFMNLYAVTVFLLPIPACVVSFKVLFFVHYSHYVHRVQKKGATDFFAATLPILYRSHLCCGHKFWAYDFLLCFVCFIDTGFCKCDRYKHVQVLILVWNVLLLCLRLSRGMVAT